MNRATTPLAVFAYNRPHHLAETLSCLLKCEGVEGHPINVYFDGPHSKNDAELVDLTRKTARDILGGGAQFHFASSNRGLSTSIISGVTDVCDRFGSVIVIEDDLLVAPSFLQFMVDGIKHCARHDSVCQVSGHMYDVPELTGLTDAVYLPLTTTWGWATWRAAWRQFDPLAQGWHELQRNAALRRRFNLDGSYDYASMLERQMSGAGKSWGIRWYWSVFQNSGLTLFPPQSLVKNIGQDGSGTHGGGMGIRKFAGNSRANWPTHTTMPLGAPAVDPAVWRFVKQAIWRQNGGFTGHLVDKVRRALRM